MIEKCDLCLENKFSLISHVVQNIPFPHQPYPSSWVCPTCCLRIGPWKVESYSQKQQENVMKLAVFIVE